MPKPKKYNMTDAEVSDMKLISANRVLVCITQKNVDRVTPSGILMVSPTDTDWQPEVHADRWGEVVQIPNQLKREKTHLWNTDIDIQVGDTIWWDMMVSENADTITTETNTYLLLDYFSLHVVKRGDKVIPLNGYSMFTLVSDESKSEFAIKTGKKDARYGTLKYKAEINEYYFDELTDDDSVQVGDKCIFRNPPVLLESEYHAVFDGKEQYRISQLYNIVAYVRDDKLYPTVNHVIIEPDIPTHTKRGIEIPAPFRKPSGYGRVYDSGYHEIKDGDEVFYPPPACVTIEHDNKKLHIIHYNSIIWYRR